MPLSSLVRGTGGDADPAGAVPPADRAPRRDPRATSRRWCSPCVVEQVAELLGHRRRGGRPALPPPRLRTDGQSGSPGRTAGTRALRSRSTSGTTRGAVPPGPPRAAATPVPRGVPRPARVPARQVERRRRCRRSSPTVSSGPARRRPRRTRDRGDARAARRRARTSSVVARRDAARGRRLARGDPGVRVDEVAVDDERSAAVTGSEDGPAAAGAPSATCWRRVSVSVTVSTARRRRGPRCWPSGVNAASSVTTGPRPGPRLGGVGHHQSRRCPRRRRRPSRRWSVAGSGEAGSHSASRAHDPAPELVEDRGADPAAGGGDVEGELAAARDAPRTGRAARRPPPGTVTPRSDGASTSPERVQTVTSATAGPRSGLVSSSVEAVLGPGADAGEPLVGPRRTALGRRGEPGLAHPGADQLRGEPAGAAHQHRVLRRRARPPRRGGASTGVSARRPPGREVVTCALEPRPAVASHRRSASSPDGQARSTRVGGTCSAGRAAVVSGAARLDERRAHPR